MPVVAPKVKVVRVSGVPSSNVRVIDLGVINAADVTATGLLKLEGIHGEQLDLPGRLIEEIYFTPDNYVQLDGASDIMFLTPNTYNVLGQNTQEGGVGTFVVGTGNSPTDTRGLQALGSAPLLGLKGGVPPVGYQMSFRDVGPLYAGIFTPRVYQCPYRTWQADTKYVLNDFVRIGDNLHYVTTNGVSGSTEPTWNPTPNGTTDDGTVQWTNDGAIATLGTIHVHAVVSDQTDTAIPQIGSVVFVQQPTNVAALTDITPPVSVQVLDKNDQPYTMFPVQVELAILGAGTLNFGGSIYSTPVTFTTDPTTGIVTFTGNPGFGLQITEPGTGYILRARADFSINIAPVDSDPFNVTAP